MVDGSLGQVTCIFNSLQDGTLVGDLEDADGSSGRPKLPEVTVV